MSYKLGSNLDLFDYLSKELREVSSKLVEADNWFVENGKDKENRACQNALQKIVKATFLIERMASASQKTLSNTNQASSIIAELMARAA
jgi:GTPase involved in cell partitioning and DNA repair